jgi:hypothetical protein
MFERKGGFPPILLRNEALAYSGARDSIIGDETTSIDDPIYSIVRDVLTRANAVGTDRRTPWF